MRRIYLIHATVDVPGSPAFAQQAPSDNGIESFIGRFLESNSPARKTQDRGE
jgi:hypothetical protein